MGQPQRLALAVVENMSGFMQDEIVEGIRCAEIVCRNVAGRFDAQSKDRLSLNRQQFRLVAGQILHSSMLISTRSPSRKDESGGGRRKPPQRNVEESFVLNHGVGLVIFARRTTQSD